MLIISANAILFGLLDILDIERVLLFDHLLQDEIAIFAFEHFLVYFL